MDLQREDSVRMDGAEGDDHLILQEGDGEVVDVAFGARRDGG